MNFSNGNHPIWDIIRLIVMMVALTAILYMTANKFDQTEIKTVIFAFIAGGAGIGLESFVRAIKGKSNGG